jgi:hypothetical protein
MIMMAAMDTSILGLNSWTNGEGVELSFGLAGGDGKKASEIIETLPALLFTMNMVPLEESYTIP